MSFRGGFWREWFSVNHGKIVGLVSFFARLTQNHSGELVDGEVWVVRFGGVIGVM